MKPPSPCLIRYWAGSHPAVAAGTLPCRSACRSAGAGDGGAGEGSADLGRVGQWGLSGRGRGAGSGRRRPDLPRCSGSCPAPLLSRSSPPVPQYFWSRPPSSRPPSFSRVDQVQSPASASLRGSLGNLSISLQRTDCRNGALGPSYVTGEKSLTGRLCGPEKRLDSTFRFLVPEGAGQRGRRCLILRGTWRGLLCVRVASRAQPTLLASESFSVWGCRAVASFLYFPISYSGLVHRLSTCKRALRITKKQNSRTELLEQPKAFYLSINLQNIDTFEENDKKTLCL